MKTKIFIIGLIIITTAVVFIAKLFFIQVVDITYKVSADNNTLRYVTQYPSRGKIFDRNGKVLVSNKVYYDLKVVPKSLLSFDTAEFCSLTDIKKDEFIISIKQNKNSYRPIVVKKQIENSEYALIQEQLYKFPGFYVEKRTLREYRKLIAAHLLGYTAEVSVEELKSDNYYKSGDYIGKSGIEKVYEKVLRGKKGVKIYIVDVHGKVQGHYKNGKYDEEAIAGKNLVSTIDSELQEYGEQLLQNKIGSIVAIEPETGEILTLVSSPGYTPDLFVGRKLSENYGKIEKQKGKPLFNRALRSMYPPGSTFKLVNALIALQQEVINSRTVFVTYGYDAGTHIVGDHISGAITFQKAIQFSSNAYFCNVYKRMITNKIYPNYATAYEAWKTYVESFGLGINLKTDLGFEKSGILYSHSYFDRYYGKGRWNYNTIISLAIGQGELGFTPLQTANMISAIANRGYYITPHIIKEIEEDTIDNKFKIKHYTKVDEKYFKPVIDAAEKVVSEGTGYSAYTYGLDICGKTGTVQNPHGADHSIFIAFAPKDNPKIAISVYVENAGFGSTWAAPIAGLMIEKYLTDTITKPWQEKRILNADFMKK
ncbi:MAG: penicillin-binding protein 2 [Bacteroidales bacterium]|nr:penicillin-binding protein 2 [Bacteroidales bacterium]